MEKENYSIVPKQEANTGTPVSIKIMERDISEEIERKNPTYYGTVVNNPAWQAWEKVAHEYGYDWHESVECGWLSPGHFQAFLDWHKRYKNNYDT